MFLCVFYLRKKHFSSQKKPFSCLFLQWNQFNSTLEKKTLFLEPWTIFLILLSLALLLFFSLNLIMFPFLMYFYVLCALFYFSFLDFYFFQEQKFSSFDFTFLFIYLPLLSFFLKLKGEWTENITEFSKWKIRKKNFVWNRIPNTWKSSNKVKEN